MGVIATLTELIDAMPMALMVPLLLLGFAPFFPEPHIVEKTRFLLQGTLTKPIDIFDLAMHGTPLIVVSIKLYRTYL